uniref:FAD-dependent oxidoreductase n=1 Tax=Alkalibacillus haloalkaliphilus TaxID=94136 RepID=UPI00036A0A07
AGYVAANFLAESNISVVLIEKGKEMGGRARTNHIQGQYFNLGPHALYKKGKAKLILEELGITLEGKTPKLNGSFVDGNHEFDAPFTPLKLITTKYFNWKERLEFIKILMEIKKTDTNKVKDLTFKQWLEQRINSNNVRSIIVMLGRLATYCHAPERVSAKVIINHLKLVMGGVTYLDGGWQSMIDQLHNKAIALGVSEKKQRNVIKITPNDNDLFQLKLSNDQVILSNEVICTTSPHELNRMLNKRYTEVSEHFDPVCGATLDIALSQLPNTNKLLALGLHEPLYYSVHSTFAKLSDHEDGVVLHVFKYFHPDEKIESKQVKLELEQFLDRIQPGWRKYEIASRCLPQIVVNQRVPQIGDEKKLSYIETDIDRLYIAGDWTSSDLILSEAAVSSGKKAAEEILRLRKGEGRIGN